MNEESRIASGLLLAVVGVWVVARTVTHDAQKRNLVDRILSVG